MALIEDRYYRRSLKDRIKKAWRILTKGHLYTNQMCIHHSRMKLFTDGLLKAAEEAKVEEQKMLETLNK